MAALVCGSVAAMGMLQGKVTEHAHKAEVSATGAKLQIAVTAPAPEPIPASTGKLATLPSDYADKGAAAPRAPVRHAAASAPEPEAVEDAAPADDEGDAVAPPRYARADPRWGDAGQVGANAYAEPPPGYAPPRGRYRPYRQYDDQGPDDRAAPDDRYAPGPYLSERYDPPWRR